MATQRKAKSVLATKYSNKPDDLSHAYYAPERLAEQLVQSGASQEEIRSKVLSFVEGEIEKCRQSVHYFANTYGWIIGHGDAGLIPFTMEGYQKELLSAVKENKYTICVKSRQLGCSTAVVFYALWFSMFTKGKRTLVVAHKRESAEEFITKFKTAYEYLPNWLKPACTKYSVKEVQFDNKSRVKAMLSNPHAARAFSATLFLLDEAAFIEKADEVFTAISPTVAAADARLLAFSSPNGDAENQWFYKTAMYAKQKLNGWKYLEFPWTVSSVFQKDPNFKENQIRINNGNVDKFKQEFECNFSVNINTLFSKDALDAFDVSDKILNKTYNGITYDDTYYIWKLAEPGKRYKIGVDCASNKSSAKDYTSFQVVEEDSTEQVAEYIGKLPTEVFVDVLLKTAKYYNNAELIIEENSYSEIVFYLLSEQGYSNVWCDSRRGNRPGYNTNRFTRPLLIEKLLLMYNTPYGAKNLHSARLKLQFQNFSATKAYVDGTKRMEAIKGNDDAVFALALAVVPIVPKDYTSRSVTEDIGIAMSAKNLENSMGNYSDEYLEHFSKKMGISKSMLESRLKLYHDIKSGKYDGTAMGKVKIEHPVKEFERTQAAAEFLGVPQIAQLDTVPIDSLTKKRSFDIDDIFDESLGELTTYYSGLFNRLKN